jgi:acyl-CoA hydrolase
MPYTYGDAQIYENEIDYLVEVDETLQEKPVTAATDIHSEIGNRIAALVEDNSTLQLGIGGVPDAVLLALRQRKGLRIWSEMFSDGVLELSKVGALDEEILITASFTFGSKELYQWLDLNKKVRMLRTERTNDPRAQTKEVVAVHRGAYVRQSMLPHLNYHRQIAQIELLEFDYESPFEFWQRKKHSQLVHL